MIEFWAVVGKMIVDPEFHQEVFEAARYREKFDNLLELRALLRKEHRLNLGRWEVMKINEIATERVEKGPRGEHNKVPVMIPEEDSAILDVRAGWMSACPDLEDRRDLYAVVGLACMDSEFRRQVHVACDHAGSPNLTPLARLLTDPLGDTPFFDLGFDDLAAINDFFRRPEVMTAQAEFHETNWVQPHLEPCNAGFTAVPGTQFQYVSETNLRIYLKKDAGTRQNLQTAGAIM